MVLGFDENRLLINENINSIQVVRRIIKKYLKKNFENDLDVFKLTAKYDPNHSRMTVREFEKWKHIKITKGNTMVINFVTHIEDIFKIIIEPE